MVAAAATARRRGAAAAVCSRILVGVDASPESLEAARQAACLLDVGGTLTLLAAYEIPPPTLLGGRGGGIPIEVDEDLLRDEAALALQVARREVGDAARVEERIVRGRPWDALCREAERGNDTLIAVGSHGRGRMTGLALGSTATALAHKAPCSVLVARASPLASKAVVVGVDGSPASIVATEVALHLSQGLGGAMRALAATGGRPVDVDGLVELRRMLAEATAAGARTGCCPITWCDKPPVEALVDASRGAGLLIVGSRHLHGLAALGSVGERLAHRAPCSVLIVRTAPMRSLEDTPAA
jgi:nucleotide-binding universal stress UspA family protein